MRFLFPLGLIGLVGVPVLILIYIIKNKFTEQTIPSTYIWEESERFLGRRRPISKLANIISLVLQILAVVIVSLAIAHPVLTLRGAAHDYLFVLDGSGSMNIEENGTTRFERAKSALTDIVDDAANGSTFTVVFAGKTTETVIESMTDKERVKQAVAELKSEYVASSTDEAMLRAQAIFTERPATITYVITDKHVAATQNIGVIDVGGAATNRALCDVRQMLSGGGLTVTGSVIVYADEAAPVTVELYSGEGGRPVASAVVEPQIPREKTEFTLTAAITSFDSLTVRLAGEDAYPADDEVVLYNVLGENISETLLVSDYPFFIKSALSTAGNSRVRVASVAEYEYSADALTGFGLYIFDSFTPDKLPSDGAVWFFDPQGGLAGTGFSYQGEATPHGLAEYSRSTASGVVALLEGTTRAGFELKEYVKCGLGGTFLTLVDCGGNPLVFAGNNVYGNREAVFAFDLHDTVFPLSSDWPVLVSNLIGWSFPDVVDETLFVCGDTLRINVLPGCDSIRVTAPSGKQSYPDSAVDVSEYELGEPGAYSVAMSMKDGSERVVRVYAASDVAESDPYETVELLYLEGEKTNAGFDGYYDDLMALFIALVAIAAADYVIYCYEQYRL